MMAHQRPLQERSLWTQPSSLVSPSWLPLTQQPLHIQFIYCLWWRCWQGDRLHTLSGSSPSPWPMTRYLQLYPRLGHQWQPSIIDVPYFLFFYFLYMFVLQLIIIIPNFEVLWFKILNWFRFGFRMKLKKQELSHLNVRFKINIIIVDHFAIRLYLLGTILSLNKDVLAWN